MRRTSKLQNMWKTLFEYKFFKLEYDEKPVGDNIYDYRMSS